MRWNLSGCDWSAFSVEVGVALGEWMGDRKGGGVTDLEVLWPEFVKILLGVAEQKIGFRVKRKGARRGVRHWSDELESLKRARREALKRKRRFGTHAAKRAYQVAHNNLRKALKAARRGGWEKMCGELERCDRNSRWKKLRSFHSQNSGSAAPHRLSNGRGEFIENAKERVDTQNDFYSSVSERMDCGDFDDEFCERVESFVRENEGCFAPGPCEVVRNEDISLEEVEAGIRSLKPSKACGDDGIYAEMIKNGGVGLSRALLWLFNLSWSQSYLPLDWRTASITPVPKIPHACECSHFRPISLLSVVSKLMESVVHTRLSSAAERGGWLSDYQGAYRKGRSGVDQLLHMSQGIHDCFENGLVAVAAFVDVSKAYECVWADGLLFLLMQLGVSGNMLGWIRAFLTGRRGRVRVGGAVSEFRDYACGIPQGSVLSPLLFNLFTSDLFASLKGYFESGVEVASFADDLRVLAFCEDACEAAGRVSMVLGEIKAWGRRKRLSFSRDKMKFAVFARRDVRVVQEEDCEEERVFWCGAELKVFMEGVRVKYQRYVKHLGIWWDHRLAFDHHVRILSGKAWRALNSIRRLSGKMWGLSLSTMRVLYLTMVLPVMEYGVAVWGCASTQSLLRLQRVQRSALLSMSGALPSTSTSSLEVYCGVQPLLDRLEFLQMSSLHRIRRLNGSHPMHCRYRAYTCRSRPSHALSRSFLSRTLALERRLARFCDVSYGDDSLVEPLGSASVSVPFFSTVDDMRALCVYTDGSASPNPGPCSAAAFFRFCDHHWTESWFMGIGNNVMAELFAVRCALESVCALPGPLPPVRVFVDCKPVVQLVCGQLTPHSMFGLLDEVLLLAHSLVARTAVSVSWVPGHSGIHGNEVADRAAKRARFETSHPLCHPVPGQPLIPLSVAKSLTRRSFGTRWQSRWSLTCESKSSQSEHTLAHFVPVVRSPRVASLGRRCEQVVLAQLRLGHCRLAEPSYRCGLSESPLCRCGAPESVSHFLLECALFADQRRVMSSAVSRVLPSVTLSSLLGLDGQPRTDSDLCAVMTAVYSFVCSTRRFSV